MKNLYELNVFRVRGKAAIDVYGSEGDGCSGAFVIPSPIDRAPMVVIASNDAGWDHISVSRQNRCPNWAEMEHVARLFFRDDEAAMQLHVPASEHINIHPNVLHWWRSHDHPIPRPPRIFV